MNLPFDFRKLTGPIEHWLTTLHQDYWGFRPDKREAWENIRINDVFVFHASRSEFLDAPRGALTDIDTGIIGLGRIGAKSTKREPVWWEEIHLNGDYPYLIHFSEIYWFGDVENIRDAPVVNKDREEMINDVHALSENIITFREMRERADYQIPAQGSPGNIRSPEKLFPLLRERITTTLETIPSEEEQAASVESNIRERRRDRKLDADQVENQEVTYEQSIHDTITGTIEHEETLDIFEDYLGAHGFRGGETSRSDLVMKSNEHVVLGEAKSVNEYNETNQIRRGIGQLLEYRYRDIYKRESWSSLQIMLCLVLSQPPSEDYQEVLRSLEADGIFTFWIRDGEVDGLGTSMRQMQNRIE